ncbi:MAG: lysophospholipid acyltransferase family protein [Acidimicrobiales bacterium]
MGDRRGTGAERQTGGRHQRVHHRLPADAAAEVETSTGGAADGAPSRHDHPHHRFSLIDTLEERIEHGLHEPVFQRDPAFIETVVPLLEATRRYFDAEVRGIDRFPASGPFLVVGNHSGGIWMPDVYAFLLAWYRARGTEAPLYSLGFDFLFSLPGVRSMARRMGTIPASQENAAKALEAGAPVVVYPGGDTEDYRPWTDRHRIELHGRKGFVRLALRYGVPVYPMVAHGSHDAIFVLTRGDNLARAVGFDRLRINIFPFVAGPPWGIAPVQLPTLPMPAKVTVKVCEPLDWSGFGPEAATDEAVVQHCYEEILGRMQATMDELVAERPHPIASRIRTALPFVR